MTPVIQYMSDLHLEFAQEFVPKNAGADVLVLAGDIFTVHGVANTRSKRRRYTEFFEHVSRNWKDVIVVLGNHEYYGYKRSTLAGARQFLAKWVNIHLLENESIMIGHTTFVGATLWTDFFGNNPLHELAVRQGMNDYRVTTLTTGETYRKHLQSREYISWVAKNNSHVVVVTHHAPSSQSVADQYKNDPLNAGYYSHMEEFILAHPSIYLWIHGHMHNTSSYEIGNCAVRANPKGYPHEQNPEFEEGATYE